MNTFVYILKILPLIILLLALIYLFAKSIGRVYLDYRVKLALLEKLEHRPELLHSFQELQTLLDGDASDAQIERPLDLTLTGVLLAVIGIICVIGYSTIGGGRWAVGAYWGGVACVSLGFILALFGVFTRFLSRTPVDRKPRS